MKQILLKSLYSFIIAYVIFNVITWTPINSFIAIALLHLLVILIGLLELGAKLNKKFKIIPHMILAVLFFIWAWISPDSFGGNNFYLIPLTIGISQLILTIIEIRKLSLINKNH